MTEVIETLLLLALPASGKSEVRRYLSLQPDEICERDFHLGPTVQLDDFPYVHMMRRVDEELSALGRPRIFFRSGEEPFLDAREWGTLIHLINEDYSDLRASKISRPVSAAQLLLARIDAAAVKVGLAPRLVRLDGGLRQELERRLEGESRRLLDEKHDAYVGSLAGRTVVIEFARGGADGAPMPLPQPYGYGYSLSQLSEDILSKAGILYIWVTPEESRRKNAERADPDQAGSILHHGVPREVMLNDYGCDDMEWLLSQATPEGSIVVERHGRRFTLPVARFDNRVDKTSFIRRDPAHWDPTDVAKVHEGLSEALAAMNSFEAA